MTDPANVRARAVWIELFFALLIVLGGLRLGWMTYQDGYFPQPFFLDPDDTWRDWFSTAIWAHQDGAYDSWLSIYPPLSFVFLKFVGLPQCYEYAPITTVRDCDWVGVVAMHAIYVLNIVLTAKTYMKIDRRTALARSLAVSVGMPMLFGLERGNLILLCFTFVVLGFGPLVRSARLRWLCVALAVNLKVYLIASVATQLLRRRWLPFEAMVLLTAVVWLITFFIYGAGTPLEVYNDIVNWAGGSTPTNVLDIWYPNTYIPLQYILGGTSGVPVNVFLSSDLVNAALFFIPVSTRLAQASIIVAAIATWLRPEVVPPYRLAFFGSALAMLTSETSIYTQPILFFFVFMEPWKGWARPVALITTYLLCIPGDIVYGTPIRVPVFSFISGHFVLAEYKVGIEMFIRPFFLMLPAYLLSIATIRDVWVDMRTQGWSKRRWCRHDWPLLPGVRRPDASMTGASA